MKKVPLNNIIQRIHQEKGFSNEEINSKIKNKIEELSGLVSEEGAAHIVANELGVQIFGENKLKVSEIMSNMKDITVIGKVVAIFDLVEFQKDSNPGKVRSVILGDETGKIRVSFWHSAADAIDGVTSGTILRLEGVVSRENNRQPEISVANPEQVKISPEGIVIDVSNEEKTKKIVELTGGNSAILGTVVQTFRPTFYDRCPECNKKVVEGSCSTHGKVEAKKACIFNIIVDDGSASIRCVFFNELAENISGVAIEELEAKNEEVRKNIIGTIVKISGSVRFSEFLGENEIIANFIDDVDIEKEVMNLNSKLE